MYTFDVTNGILRKLDKIIVQDDTKPDYQEYIQYLQAGGEVTHFSGDPIKTPEQVLDEARSFGRSVMDSFMRSALENGANQAGLAGSLVNYFLPVVQALEIGSLHAATEFLEQMLLQPEIERPAYPFTSDVSLMSVLTSIRNEIDKT